MKTRLLLCLFCCALQVAWSQDYHHWSEHFGARASLLGGAATSGLGDNATVYYNPAAMAFVENPSLSISVNAYRLRRLKIENGLGQGLDLKATQFSTMPNLIAGITEFKKPKRVRLGYAVLSRRSYTNKFDMLHQANYDILSSTAGDEIFVGSYNLYHQLNEFWAGFGVSLQLSESFSIGFSHMGIYRDVKYSNAHSTSILPADGSLGAVPSVSTTATFNYWNVKGVFKPSIALSLDNFKFGITLTTPTFNILGRANVYRDYSIVNFNELIGTDLVFIDRADAVKAKHREHGALAFGVSWRLGKKAWLHVTNETFFGGKQYMIFDPDQRPSIYPPGLADTIPQDYFGGQNFLALAEQTTAVTNLGIGLEAKIANHWEMYTGMRTDFMYNERPYYTYTTIGIESSKWHILHFSLGFVNHTKKGKRYTVGLEYGWVPRRRYYHILDYTTPSVSNGLVGEGSADGFAQQHSFKMLLEIIIGKNKKKEESPN